ncbi:helix-turn-helix transcriptional regulator [Streptomyces microflavus]|uniref:helix-turn-helix domain-containing protein n=1 Tax=Streptomyces microflavus TaxID=1919 RepID=UPI0033186867
MSEDWTRLSAAIRTARKARGWTQHQLAEKAGIGFSTVQRLEGGAPFTRRPPSLDRIERALGWQLGSADAVLAGGDPEPTGSVDAAAPREAGDIGAPPAKRLPRRIEHELASGEVLDTEVLQLGNSRVRMIIVATFEPGDGDDQEAVAEDLEAWTRVQHQLRNMTPSEGNP